MWIKHGGPIVEYSQTDILDAAAVRRQAAPLVRWLESVKAEMAVEAFARSVAVLLLPILAFACIVADPGPMATLGVWLAWMVLALAIDTVSPRVGRTRDAAGSMTTALLFTAPLLLCPMDCFGDTQSADVDRDDRGHGRHRGWHRGNQRGA